MFPVKEFEKRLHAILEELDDAADGDEAIEELNAELEDALFMLSQIDPSGEDADEEFEDAADEFEALAEDYCDRAKDCPEIEDPAIRLKSLVAMMKSALE